MYLLGLYKPNGKSWGWGGGRDSIDEYRNQNQENMKGQSGSSVLTCSAASHVCPRHSA